MPWQSIRVQAEREKQSRFFRLLNWTLMPYNTKEVLSPKSTLPSLASIHLRLVSQTRAKWNNKRTAF